MNELTLEQQFIKKTGRFAYSGINPTIEFVEWLKTKLTWKKVEDGNIPEDRLVFIRLNNCVPFCANYKGGWFRTIEGNLFTPTHWMEIPE